MNKLVGLLQIVCRNGPDSFERDLGFQIGIKLIVGGEKGFQKFQLRPETNLKKTLGQFLMDMLPLINWHFCGRDMEVVLEPLNRPVYLTIRRPPL